MGLAGGCRQLAGPTSIWGLGSNWASMPSREGNRVVILRLVGADGQAAQICVVGDVRPISAGALLAAPLPLLRQAVIVARLCGALLGCKGDSPNCVLSVGQEILEAKSNRSSTWALARRSS